MTSDTLDGGFNETLDAPRYAGFGKRFLAYLLDFVILFIPAFAVGFYFINVAPNAIGYLLATLLISLYKPILEGLYGATVGKMILKLKVVDAAEPSVLDAGGSGPGLRPATIAQAFMRWIPFVVGGVWSWINQYGMIEAMGEESLDGMMEVAAFQTEYNAALGTGYYIAIALSLLLPLASALYMLTNPKKQAAHDILGGTYVLDVKPQV